MNEVAKVFFREMSYWTVCCEEGCDQDAFLVWDLMSPEVELNGTRRSKKKQKIAERIIMPSGNDWTKGLGTKANLSALSWMR